MTENECNDICLYASDLGLPEYGNAVAYAHPDCPVHGDPLPDPLDADVCMPGYDEIRRYVREEDIAHD